MESDDPDADTANIFPQLMLIIVLTAVNAFFAAAEMAVVSANKNKIRRLALEGDKKARNVEKLTSDETKFLSTIQVGITLAGFFSSATASMTLSEGIGKWLLDIGVPYGNKISMVLITLVLSYITLIFGELLPKRIALRNPEKTSMRFAGALLVVKFLGTPFVKLLSGSCNLLVKLFKIESNSAEEKVSDEDIIDVVTEGVSEGSVEEDKQKIIQSTLKFYHLYATDLMTPRVDVFMIDIDDELSFNIEKMLNEKYTRVPVYKETKDNIIGIVNVKDVLVEAHKKGFDSIDIMQIMREPFFAREFIDANELFSKMQSENQQVTLLLDEFGGFSGLVTMEDLVEEIVGNIYDEFDDDADIIQQSENSYILNGSLAIHEINTELSLKLDEDNDKYDTISGLIITTIERIPRENENIELEVGNVQLKVLKMEKNRISKVLLTVVPEVELDENESQDKEN